MSHLNPCVIAAIAVHSHKLEPGAGIERCPVTQRHIKAPRVETLQALTQRHWCPWGAKRNTPSSLPNNTFGKGKMSGYQVVPSILFINLHESFHSLEIWYPFNPFHNLSYLHEFHKSLWKSVLSTSCPSDFNVGSAGVSEVATVEVLSGSTGDESEDRAWAPLELEMPISTSHQRLNIYLYLYLYYLYVIY